MAATKSQCSWNGWALRRCKTYSLLCKGGMTSLGSWQAASAERRLIDVDYNRATASSGLYGYTCGGYYDRNTAASVKMFRNRHRETPKIRRLPRYSRETGELQRARSLARDHSLSPRDQPKALLG